jgi:hypothetical protein
MTEIRKKYTVIKLPEEARETSPSLSATEYKISPFSPFLSKITPFECRKKRRFNGHFGTWKTDENIVPCQPTLSFFWSQTRHLSQILQLSLSPTKYLK